MRILQVAPYFSPYVGGQEVHVRSLSKYLAQRGHEVTVATSDYPAGQVSHEEGYEILRWPVVFRIMRNPIGPQAVLLAKTARKYDIIHFHNLYAFSTAAGLMRMGKVGPKTVVTDHGTLRFGSPGRDLLVQLYNITVLPLLLRKVNRVIVQSVHDHERILRERTEKSVPVDVIPNALDTDGLNAVRDAGVPRELGRLLFVGPLTTRKGIFVMIEALSNVFRDAPHTECLIAGDGANRREAERLTKPWTRTGRVKFLGYISREQLQRLYATSSLLVLPSLSEGLPTVLLEALYFGCPVIASRLPSIEEHFSRVVRFAEPGDPESLSLRITESLKDVDAIREEGRRGRLVVESEFSWNSVIESVIQSYSAALRGDT